MATETQDGVELRNSVDNTDAEAGLKRLEEAANATSRRIADNAEKAAARQARADEGAARAAAARAGKITSMALAYGTGAAGVVGQALRLGGYERAGDGISAAATGARELGTMLSPLGPGAAAAGAALGGVTGALKSLADAAAETHRRLGDAARAARNMSADQALAREDMERLAREDPDAAARAQHEMQETLRRAAARSGMGAEVDLDSIAHLAAFDPDAVARIFTEQRLLGNEGGERARAVFEAMDYDETRADRDALRAVADDSAGGVLRWRTHMSATNRARALDERLAVAEAAPDILAAFQGRGGGWDAALSARWDEMEAERLAALAPPAGAETPSGSAATLVAPRADALSAQGIGYTGNPMGKTEELLREIRDDARENARRAGAAPLLA